MCFPLLLVIFQNKMWLFFIVLMLDTLNCFNFFTPLFWLCDSVYKPLSRYPLCFQEVTICFEKLYLLVLSSSLDVGDQVSFVFKYLNSFVRP